MPYAQPDLFDAPYQSASDTSRDAAVKARDFVGEQGKRVLAWVEERGAYGATTKEAEAEMPIQRASACARFRALQLRGDLIKTAERRVGCAVYVVSETR
jgi:hypothetical protein